MTRISILFLFVLLCSSPLRVLADKTDGISDAFRSTPYPLPRFVSLRSDEVFVRTGPGPRYPVKWIFKKEGLPVEIILEFENWRKIRDYEGQTGWVHHSLLSGRRTGLVRADDAAELYKKPDTTAPKLALFEPNAAIALEDCRSQWCKVQGEGYSGWMQRKFIWGIYEDEIID